MDRWVSVLLSGFMLGLNNGCQQCCRCQGEHNESASVVLDGDGVLLWAGAASQFITVLHFVNGTVTVPDSTIRLLDPLYHKMHLS